MMSGYQRLQDLFYKNKWTPLLLIFSTAFFCLYLKYVLRVSPKFAESHINEDLEELNLLRSKAKVSDYYDLLLNGYMRGGSSLAGMVFGYRSDSFYWYEPMWKISCWNYWHGNETVCRSDRLECRNVAPNQTEKHKSFDGNLNSFPTGSLAMAMAILHKTYDCLFNGFEQTVVQPSFNYDHGPSWNNVTACLKNKVKYQSCFRRHIPRACLDSRHIVTKGFATDN